MPMTETFDTVFDSLADSPFDAANLTARTMIIGIRRKVAGWETSHTVPV